MEYRGRFPVQRRGKDYLRIRLRRMVKAVLEERGEDAYCDCEFIVSNRQHIISKAAWIVVFCVCIGLFSFQTYDRIDWYFSYPVSVTGRITTRVLQTFPHLTVCYEETNGFFNLTNTLKTKKLQCPRNAIRLLLTFPKISLQEVWERMNTSTAVASAKGISGGKIFPLDTVNKKLKEGICTTFYPRANMPLSTADGKVEIILNQYKGKCALQSSINVYLHDERSNIMVQSFLLAEIGKMNEIEMTVREVRFVNRSKSPCVSAEEYAKCEESCFTAFLNKSQKCKLPFYPTELNKQECVGPAKQLDKYWNFANKYLVGLVDKVLCSCTRKCQHRTFSERINFDKKYDNQTIITLVLEDPHETLIKEDLSYDMISLLSDIGGNSGLYIGLSVLSMFELIIKPVRLLIKKKPKKFSSYDPFFRKVKKTFETFNYLEIQQKDPLKSTALLKWFTIAGCSVFWLWTVYNRISLFLEHPTRVAIDISFNTTFELPTLTICFGDPKIKKMKQIIANRNNISQICDVKDWELFNVTIRETLQIRNKSQGFPFRFKHSTYDLFFEGACQDLGFQPKVLPSYRLKWFYELIQRADSTICGTSYFKVYIKPLSRRIDFYQYRYASKDIRTMIKFVIKEIRNDESMGECVSEEENDECMDNCLRKKLFSKITCRLHYMPNGSLPLCETLNSAMNSYLKYLETYLIPSSTLGCKCLPKCITPFYTTETMSTPLSGQGAVIGFGASHNVVESYTKEQTYPLVKLLCDIGGLLGSMLGLCVLSTVEVVLQIVGRRRRNNRR